MAGYCSNFEPVSTFMSYMDLIHLLGWQIYALRNILHKTLILNFKVCDLDHKVIDFAKGIAEINFGPISMILPNMNQTIQKL